MQETTANSGPAHQEIARQASADLSSGSDPTRRIPRPPQRTYAPQQRRTRSRSLSEFISSTVLCLLPAPAHSARSCSPSLPTFAGWFKWLARRSLLSVLWIKPRSRVTANKRTSTTLLVPSCLAGADAAPSAGVARPALATKAFGAWRAGATLATPA